MSEVSLALLLSSYQSENLFLSDDKKRYIYQTYKLLILKDFMDVKRIRREGTQLKITIPKRAGLKEGDYIIFEKLNSELVVSSAKTRQPSSPLQDESS